MSVEVIIPQDVAIFSIMGRQKKKNIGYRLSKYVIFEQISEGILLYNILTCELLFLKGAKKLELCDELIEKWFFVPNNFEDYKNASQIKNLRQLLYKSELKLDTPIEKFTILTTTKCNARCFYCHEKGIPNMTMTEEIANQVIRYIEIKSQKKPIMLKWYGGEPLVNSKVIDSIALGLNKRKVEFYSIMISNGYLFDEFIVEKAVNLWKLKKIQITLDGLEDTYNRIKNYCISDTNSPFQRVLDNIERLLNKKIDVKIRLNFDQYNVDEIGQLAEMLTIRFGRSKHFTIYSTPLLEDCLGTNLIRDEKTRRELYDAQKEFMDYFYNNGVMEGAKLPTSMPSQFRCVAISNSKIVYPNGQLGFCQDYFEGVLSGDVYGDEPNESEKMKYSLCLPIKDSCQYCIKFPQCIRLKNCFMNKCNEQLINEWEWMTRKAMITEYNRKA